MRANLEEVFNHLGVEIVDQDEKDDCSTDGFIVVKSHTGKFLKISFYDDSYSDGYISSMREVFPKEVTKLEYI